MIKRFIFPYLSKEFYRQLASGSLSSLDVDKAYREIIQRTKSTQKRYRIFSILVFCIVGVFAILNVIGFIYMIMLDIISGESLSIMISLFINRIVLILAVSIVGLFIVEHFGVYGLGRRFLKAHKVGYPNVGAEDLVNRQKELKEITSCENCGSVEFAVKYGQQICKQCLTIYIEPTEDYKVKGMISIPKPKFVALRFSVVAIAIMVFLMLEISTWPLIGTPIQRVERQADVREGNTVAEELIDTIPGWNREIFDAIAEPDVEMEGWTVVYLDGDCFEELVGIVGPPNTISTHRDAETPFSVATWHSEGQSRFLASSSVWVHFDVDTNIIIMARIDGASVADWADVERGLELIHYLPGWSREIFESIEVATRHRYADEPLGYETFTGGGS